MELIETSGDFELLNYAENFIAAYIKGTTPYVILGATETTKQLAVPFPHRIIKMVIRHTNSANADAITALDVQIRRDVGHISILPLGQEILQTQADLINANIELTFGEGFEYEPTVWTLAFTGTNTDRIHILVYIQRLGKR